MQPVPDASHLAVRWITSSYSGGGNNCVQAAVLGHANVVARDSKAPHGPALVMPSSSWAAFLGRL